MDAAQQNFLETRHVLEVSTIAEQISILEGHAARVKKDLEAQVADLQRLFVYNAQNAIIARGEADRIALAEKIINDLDKPKSEVVVDVIVMEADRTRSRDIATAVVAGDFLMQMRPDPLDGVGLRPVSRQ